MMYLSSDPLGSTSSWISAQSSPCSSAKAMAPGVAWGFAARRPWSLAKARTSSRVTLPDALSDTNPLGIRYSGLTTSSKTKPRPLGYAPYCSAVARAPPSG